MYVIIHVTEAIVGIVVVKRLVVLIVFGYVKVLYGTEGWV